MPSAGRGLEQLPAAREVLHDTGSTPVAISEREQSAWMSGLGELPEKLHRLDGASGPCEVHCLGEGLVENLHSLAMALVLN